VKPIVRIPIGIALVIVGILTAAFFGLLLLIADCTSLCQANHEQLVPVGLIVLGLAFAGVGLLLLIGRLGGRPRRPLSLDK
jgi:formate-dependent nitrite reductase membrane component NrfD